MTAKSVIWNGRFRAPRFPAHLSYPDVVHPGDNVTYWGNNVLGRRVRAVVREVHPDESVTVEAIYELDEDGQAAGRFLGDVVTLHKSELSL